MLNEFAQMSYTDIAKELGISRERVRQIESRAMRRLRSNPQMKALYELYKDLCIENDKTIEK